MKALANPILLLATIAALAVQAMGADEFTESTDTVAATALALSLTGMLVNGVLAIARAATRRSGVLVLGIWSVIFLALACCAWMNSAPADEADAEELRTLTAMEQAWQQGETTPFVAGEDGLSLLERAAALGRTATAKKILALPEAAQNNDVLKGAARAAAAAGRKGTLALLLEAGVPADAEAHGQLLLHAAVLADQEKTAAYLLQHGARVDTADADGNTVLMHAALNGNRSMVKLLLKHGANRSFKNQEGLDAAAMATVEEVLELLEKED